MVRNGVFEFCFRGPKGPVVVAWARKPTPYHLGGQSVDLLTGHAITTNIYALSSSPILSEGASTISTNFPYVNRWWPFPWDGDYVKAASVSISMGATNVERGLHTLSGDAIAADVIAYGGPARAGGVPGGNAFIVDPSFLSYTSDPIEITVVVRRNPANDNAGFKLVYESTEGFKNFGWYTVPDNKQWHTKTWKITDAQFVGMWGYNFTLESDGNVYNKYYIQSVTVKKLDK
jgi:hypothetical protein